MPLVKKMSPQCQESVKAVYALVLGKLGEISGSPTAMKARQQQEASKINT
jgi:hypothetical protein